MFYDDLPSSSSISNQLRLTQNSPQPRRQLFHTLEPPSMYSPSLHSPTMLNHPAQSGERLPAVRSVLGDILGNFSSHPLSPANSTGHKRTDSTHIESSPTPVPLAMASTYSSLPTPPSTGKEPVIHNFEDASHHDASDDLQLFSQQTAVGQSLRLFSNSPYRPYDGVEKRRDSTFDQLTQYEEQQADEWRATHSVHPRPCSPPSNEDLAVFLSAIRKMHLDASSDTRHHLHDLSSFDSLSSPRRQGPPQKRIRLSKDSTSSKTLESSSISSSRPRSQHKRNAKITLNAEGENKQRAQSTKPDKDPNWQHYPDFAPSLDFVSANAIKCAEQVKQFSGNFKNGVHDPLFNQLHPAEQIVASRLSLECAKFLCAKRQLFVGYVMHLRREPVLEGSDSGKLAVPSWNKTAGQNQTKIDVNKASFLWTFYKDIGCFKPELFEEFINAPNLEYHFDYTPSTTP